MAIIDIISAFSATGILGGITGLIGNELKSRREIKLIRLENEMEQAAWPERAKEREHEEKMRAGTFAHELTLHEMNAKARSEEFEHAIHQSEVKASGKGLLMALDDEMIAQGAPQWCSAVRTLTRPVLCVLLVVLMGVIYFFGDIGQRVTITKAIVYMASVAVLFFFGDRPSSGMRKMLLGFNDRGGK